MPQKRNFQKINRNVWKLEEDGKFYSVKKYSSAATAIKVKKVHETLHLLSFPHIVPVLAHEDPLVLIQPWLVNAKPVNFNKRADRIDSFEALATLHKTKNNVEWTSLSCLHVYPLVEKWENRLVRFNAVRSKCELVLGKSKVDEILFYAVKALKIVRKTYTNEKDQTLLHGDIVHHNILRDRRSFIRFIDFDLACIGPANTEIALWIHRVLPHIDYNLEFLVNEQPVLQELDDASKAILLFPNELLREWLYFFSLSKPAQERQLSTLIIFTESALSHWPKLWYNVERMN